MTQLTADRFHQDIGDLYQGGLLRFQFEDLACLKVYWSMAIQLEKISQELACQEPLLSRAYQELEDK